MAAKTPACYTKCQRGGVIHGKTQKINPAEAGFFLENVEETY
jgi:hypothetical protein